MLDARFSHLYFGQNLYTPQRGLRAIAGLLVILVTYNAFWGSKCSKNALWPGLRFGPLPGSLQCSPNF